MEIDVSALAERFDRLAANRALGLKAAGLSVLTAAQQSIKESGPGWAPFASPPKSPHQLLWDTGTLLQSLAVGGSGNILDLTDTSVVVGTNVVYARAQNLGYSKRNLPARPFLFLDDDREKNAIEAYNAQLFRGL